MILGVNVVPWFHLYVADRFGAHISYGNFTLHELGSVGSQNYWYSIAGTIALFGGALLIISGILTLLLRFKWSRLCAVIITTLGSTVVVYVSIRTGLPSWEAHGNVGFGREPGEWLCLVGALLGITCVALAVVPKYLHRSTRSRKLQGSSRVLTPT